MVNFRLRDILLEVRLHFSRVPAEGSQRCQRCSSFVSRGNVGLTGTGRR